MAKSNYQAWHILHTDFKQSWTDIRKLRFFAKYAILAPSVHNTQPWQFISKDDSLILKPDTSRLLPYSGIEANEPYISLGACLGILELAAKGFGYKLSIESNFHNNVAAKIKIAGKTPPNPALLEAIISRVSNRNFYNTSNLPKSRLAGFIKSDLPDIYAHIISDRKDIEFIAEQTIHATHRTMSDKEFRNELSKWVRNNITKQYDGMPGFVQGIPTPPSLIAKHIIRRVNISKDQAKKDSSRVLNSANLIIIGVKTEKQDAFLSSGGLYAQVCVLAAQQNVSTSGIRATIIDPVTRESIIKRFKLPGKPIAIIRLGKTEKKARHTPRWPLETVMDKS